MQIMQRLQNVFIVAAAKCQQCSGQGSAGVRPGFGFGSGSLSLSMGRPDDRPADPCQAMRHGFEPADLAAPCANLLGGPIFGTVPTGAPDMGYD